MNATEKFYVRMTDKFMSGWGCAEGKISVFVVECDDYDQAAKVLRAARGRQEMKRVAICARKPRERAHQVVSFRHASELGPIWFQE